MKKASANGFGWLGLGFLGQWARVSKRLRARGRERARDSGGSGGEHRHAVARCGGAVARLQRRNDELRLLRARRRYGCCGRGSATRWHGAGADGVVAAASRSTRRRWHGGSARRWR
jgi:hypothetical protein